jgi:hypothetical protein
MIAHLGLTLIDFQYDQTALDEVYSSEMGLHYFHYHYFHNMTQGFDLVQRNYHEQL